MPSPAAAFLSDAIARLAALDAALGQASTPADVAWSVCEYAGRELDLADAIVYLLDPGAHTLSQHAAWGPKRAASRVLESRITLALGQGIVGRCAQLRLPQRTGDARLDDRYGEGVVASRIGLKARGTIFGRDDDLVSVAGG